MSQCLSKLLQPPRITPVRMILSLAVAIVTDVLQFVLGALGPLGWIVDDGLDAVAMVLTTWILGFHLLLLPTFVVKLVPVAEELPTWTACVVAVIALRKRDQAAPSIPSMNDPALAKPPMPTEPKSLRSG